MLTTKQPSLRAAADHSLDRFAIGFIAISVVLIWIVSSPFYRWLMLAAVLSAAYGFLTNQKDLVAAACLTPPLYLMGWYVNYAISQVTPNTIDAALARLDHGFGVAVWHWCAAHPAALLVLHPVYYGLGIAIMAGITFTDRRQQLIRALLIGAVLGLLCYYLFPAVGPIWVGTPNAIRNCMPSLHLTWALLIWIFASRRARWPMLAFLILTAVATMGLGEHYFIDLVAAVPFTTLVYFAAIKTTCNISEPLQSS